MARDSEIRAPIYLKISALLDRDLTPTEHGEIKELVNNYVKHQKEKVEEIKEILREKNEKIASLGKSLFLLLRRRGTPEKIVNDLAATLYKYENES